MTGLVIAATAYAGRYGIQVWQAFKARPASPVAFRKFYQGGFQPQMTRREAALILGVRYIIYITTKSSIHLHVFLYYELCVFNGLNV
uniref:Uncharacterized protein n=1 Tax=Lactuca sativa TaxID=4236 RepID=A0A9R1X5D1_LACSA|nr:hypothetical protein LSAT_V11C600310580 [Lactuca sativa]